MPTYYSKCHACGLLFEQVRRMADYKNTPACTSCGGGTEPAIVVPPQGFVKGKFEAFISPVDRTLITCQRDLDEHNKRNGVMNLHDGYDEKAVMDVVNKPRETVKIDKKEIVADIVAATKECEAGYKPIIHDEGAPNE